MTPRWIVSEKSSTLPGTWSPVTDTASAPTAAGAPASRPRAAAAPSISPSMSAMSARLSISPIVCVPTSRPSRSTVTRSHRSKTSSSRCETKMTLRPCATSSRVALKTRSISGLLRVAVGSSRIRSRASRTRSRAISTSCRSPIASDSTAACNGTCARPSPSSVRRARSESRRLRYRSGTSIPPRKMLSSTLSSGTRLSS